VALLACDIPARRAAGVDPIEVRMSPCAFDAKTNREKGFARAGVDASQFDGPSNPAPGATARYVAR